MKRSSTLFTFKISSSSKGQPEIKEYLSIQPFKFLPYAFMRPLDLLRMNVARLLPLLQVIVREPESSQTVRRGRLNTKVWSVSDLGEKKKKCLKGLV